MHFYHKKLHKWNSWLKCEVIMFLIFWPTTEDVTAVQFFVEGEEITAEKQEELDEAHDKHIMCKVAISNPRPQFQILLGDKDVTDSILDAQVTYLVRRTQVAGSTFLQDVVFEGTLEGKFHVSSKEPISCQAKAAQSEAPAIRSPSVSYKFKGCESGFVL